MSVLKYCDECKDTPVYEGKIVYNKFDGEELDEEEDGEYYDGCDRCSECDRELCETCGDFEDGICKDCREEDL